MGQVTYFAWVKRFKGRIRRVPLPSQSSCYLEPFPKGNPCARFGDRFRGSLYAYRSQRQI